MLKQILSDYSISIVLILVGLFLSFSGTVISECPMTIVPDGCLPIDDVRIMVLIILGTITMLLGIIAMPICEILKIVKTLKPDKID